MSVFTMQFTSQCSCWTWYGIQFHCSNWKRTGLTWCMHFFPNLSAHLRSAESLVWLYINCIGCMMVGRTVMTPASWFWGQNVRVQHVHFVYGKWCQVFRMVHSKARVIMCWVDWADTSIPSLYVHVSWQCTFPWCLSSWSTNENEMCVQNINGQVVLQWQILHS